VEEPVPPYEIVGELKRFSARSVVFSRAQWDPTCRVSRSDLTAEEVAARGHAGYAVDDFALNAGAWAMARHLYRPGMDAPDARYMEAAEVTGVSDASEGLSGRVKAAALFYGAARVGIARVNPLWIYSADRDGTPLDLPAGMDTAVVIAIEMDYARVKRSPSIESAAATGLGYSCMAFVASCVARYLEELGFGAIACGNDTALSIPLAIDAGLGEVGRNGLLVTPEYGPRVRLCKVLTDAPLTPDEPIEFGVREFCQVCMKCADTCPVRCISRGEPTAEGRSPSNNPGVLKWYTEPEACLSFWGANGACCSNCIASCPFNKPLGAVHDWARGIIGRRSPALDRALVWVDDALGYGRARSGGAKG
jgi:reductive dehalogenase